jgi:7-cyano-7-deazaguanine synthase
MSKVLVVLSGGQDSTTCLLQAAHEYDEVHAVTFDYGQRHRIEIEAARAVYECIRSATGDVLKSHTVLNVAGLLRGASPLVDPNAQLETYTDFEQMDKVIGNRVELTFVPLRNPFFLIAAANHALAQGCHQIMTGVCAMDNANYPDCTPGFVAAAEFMINEAMGYHRQDYAGPRLRIRTPLLNKTKAETVELAMKYGQAGYDALALSHTCYAGQRPPCGVCHACQLRAEGFRQAGVADPLVEATKAAQAVGV